jgi:hypothetical protein
MKKGGGGCYYKGGRRGQHHNISVIWQLAFLYINTGIG